MAQRAALFGGLEAVAAFAMACAPIRETRTETIVQTRSRYRYSVEPNSSVPATETRIAGNSVVVSVVNQFRCARRYEKLVDVEEKVERKPDNGWIIAEAIPAVIGVALVAGSTRIDEDDADVGPLVLGLGLVLAVPFATATTIDLAWARERRVDRRTEDRSSSPTFVTCRTRPAVGEPVTVVLDNGTALSAVTDEHGFASVEIAPAVWEAGKGRLGLRISVGNTTSQRVEVRRGAN